MYRIGPSLLVTELFKKPYDHNCASCRRTMYLSCELFAIQDRIQRQFQIPHSFQHDLNFNGKNIEDSTNLVSIGLKAGDKMEVKIDIL